MIIDKYSRLKSNLSTKMVKSISKKHDEGYFVFLVAYDNSAVIMAKGTEFIKTYVFISISGLVQTVGTKLSNIPPMIKDYKRVVDDLSTTDIFLSNKEMKMKTFNPGSRTSFADFL